MNHQNIMTNARSAFESGADMNILTYVMLDIKSKDYSVTSSLVLIFFTLWDAVYPKHI